MNDRSITRDRGGIAEGSTEGGWAIRTLKRSKTLGLAWFKYEKQQNVLPP